MARNGEDSQSCVCSAMRSTIDPARMFHATELTNESCFVRAVNCLWVAVEDPCSHLLASTGREGTGQCPSWLSQSLGVNSSVPLRLHCLAGPPKKKRVLVLLGLGSHCQSLSEQRARATGRRHVVCSSGPCRALGLSRKIGQS